MGGLPQVSEFQSITRHDVRAQEQRCMQPAVQLQRAGMPYNLLQRGALAQRAA